MIRSLILVLERVRVLPNGRRNDVDDPCCKIKCILINRPPRGGAAGNDERSHFEVNRFKFVECPQEDVHLAVSMLRHCLRSP